MGTGGESWGKTEMARQDGGEPDKSGKVDRFLGRMLRLVVRTIWGAIKLLFKGLWRLVRPSKASRDRARDRAA